MSNGKIAHKALLKTLIDNSDSIFYKLPGSHPVRKYWGDISVNCTTHDDIQDEMVLLLNEAFESTQGDDA